MLAGGGNGVVVARRSLVFVFLVSVVGTMALTKMLLVPTCRARRLDQERSAVVLLETERPRFFES
jgi:ABC-type Mn2+/Zn2+ transport system permease subunit